jgi:hypothetical protein
MGGFQIGNEQGDPAAEAATLEQLARGTGASRIYKYSMDEGEPASMWFTIEYPGDEEGLLGSPFVHHPVLVYDNGRYLS